MIPDRLQYFLDDFWNFEILTKSRPSETVLRIDYLAYLLLIYGLSMDFLAYLWLINIILGFRLINGLLGSFLAFYSALDLWVWRRGGGGRGAAPPMIREPNRMPRMNRQGH